MMQAGLAAFQAGTAAWQKAVAEALPSADGSKAAPPGPQTPGSNLFGDMFEPGLRLSQAYQREMEAVLDRLRPETGRS